LAKTSFVFQALKILGLEEMLNLSEILHAKQVPLKRAAGEELISWDEPFEKSAGKKFSRHDGDAKILEFPKKSINDLVPLPEANPDADEQNVPNLLNSELILWQREIAKSSEETDKKANAFKGYKKASEMYVVKTPTAEGKDRIRFASTNGVLINKKQA
jgi:hypothetical protein